MNFLAHLYLSGNSNELKIGNFIGDAVKGKTYLDFPPEIKRGIILHRAIDTFTDKHEIVLESKLRLRKCYGKHAGVVVDIFYDHFLSVDWQKFSDVAISDFIKESYILLIQNYFVLPGKVQKYFPFMVVNNWLEKYGHVKGIERVLNGMSKYSSLPSSTKEGIEVFTSQYKLFRNDFNHFFPLLIDMVHKEYGVCFTKAGQL